MPSTRKQAARRERVAAMRATQKRAERRRNLLTIGASAAAAVIVIGGVAGYIASRSGGEVLPSAVDGRTPVSQGPAHVVANTSGISGFWAFAHNAAAIPWPSWGCCPR